MAYNSFEEMPVWINAMILAERIFRDTEKLPRKEDYGLTSQIRRSALSVPANIAEGFGRQHTKDKINFYYNARGSLAETRNHLIYAHRVGYFTPEMAKDYKALVDDVWRALNAMISTLQKKVEPRRAASELSKNKVEV